MSKEIEKRLDRIELAIKSLAWYLVQVQSGLGVNDARKIEDILNG